MSKKFCRRGNGRLPRRTSPTSSLFARQANRLLASSTVSQFHPLTGLGIQDPTCIHAAIMESICYNHPATPNPQTKAKQKSIFIPPIISSISSKNKHQSAKSFLKKKNIFFYFFLRSSQSHEPVVWPACLSVPQYHYN